MQWLSTRWRRAPLIALGLALCLAVAPLIADFVRDVIAVPLLYLAWAVGLVWRSVPEALILLSFVLVALLVARRSLRRRGALQRQRTSPAQFPGRVEQWAQLVGAAEGGDDYARWRLAHRLANLTLDALAQRQRQSPVQLRRQMERGALALPGDLQAYLMVGLVNYNPLGRPQRRLVARVIGSVRKQASADPLAFAPAQAIALLEDVLGGTWERRDDD
jgi:hypothetical protein